MCLYSERNKIDYIKVYRSKLNKKYNKKMIYGNLTKLNKTDKNSNCKIYNHKMETSYSAIDFFILLLYQHRSFITNEMEFYLIFLERNISSSIFFMILCSDIN